MPDTECSQKVESDRKQKRKNKSLNKVKIRSARNLKRTFMSDRQARMLPVKHSTYHGVKLRSETIQEMQHSHVQRLNCIGLEETMIEDCINNLEFT